MKSVGALAARRAELIARADDERRQLAQDLAPLNSALHVADTGWSIARWLRERPMILAAASAAFATLAGRKPRQSIGRLRGVMRWARLGLGAWQAWRWVSR
jgi:hypothetical protein